MKPLEKSSGRPVRWRTRNTSLQQLQVAVKTAIAQAGVLDPVRVPLLRLFLFRLRRRCRWSSLPGYGGLIMDHRPNSLEIAETAALAAVVSTIRSVFLLQGLGVFGLQEGTINTAVQVLPRQDLVHLPTPQIGFQVEVTLGSSLPPSFEVKMLGPTVQTGARCSKQFPASATTCGRLGKKRPQAATVPDRAI